MKLPHWIELVTMSNEELAKIDIAIVNMACAVGLPGTEQMDPAFCMDRIAEATSLVAVSTERNRYQFDESPKDFDSHEGSFRMLVLSTVLTRDCGLRYNHRKAQIDSVLEPIDTFVFGVFQGTGGTCASIPIAVASVARRLGYPIKLAYTFRHLFIRWDDGLSPHINYEIGGHGLGTKPDSYYREGKFSTPEFDEIEAGYLRSLSPREELGHFLFDRGLQLATLGEDRKAMECMAWLSELTDHLLGPKLLRRCIARWRKYFELHKPPTFPEIELGYGQQRFKTVPRAMESDMAYICLVDEMLDDPELEQRWWLPLRMGMTPAEVNLQTKIQATIPSPLEFDNSPSYFRRAN